MRDTKVKELFMKGTHIVYRIQITRSEEKALINTEADFSVIDLEAFRKLERSDLKVSAAGVDSISKRNKNNYSEYIKFLH